MKLQENNSLKYRETLVEAKRAWDKNPNQRIFSAKSAIGKSIVSRQRELSIFGGGVAILSKAEGKPILLYSPAIQKHFEIKEDADEYEFLHTPYQLFKDEPHFANFIDLLFFVSREKPRPEYVSSIADVKDMNDFEYPFQWQLRKKYEILHCSTGEILFFCLLWRLIIELINKNNNLDCNYSKELFTSNNYSNDFADVFKADKYDLIEKMIMEKLEIADKSPNNILSKSVLKARDCFTKSLKKQNETKYIFEGLGLFNSTALNEINKYTEFVFGKSFIKLNKTNSNEYAHEAILAFASRAKIRTKNYSVGDLLNTLHSKSRFPILPYYFLMFFDDKKELKEHIVFPLWYTASPETKYVYDKAKKESAVLHALYTVKPIWNNKKYKSDEWYTAKNKISESKINPGFESYLNDLYSFFTSMSKPIIDKEYYAEEADKNINTVKRQATKAAISQVIARTTSHNTGSHVLTNDFEDEYIREPQNGKGAFIIDKAPLKKLRHYLRERMLLNADIGFYSEPTFTSVKLNKLLDSFCENKVVVKYISGINGKRFEGFTVCEECKKISVALPNGVLGFQAFYVLSENLIRNYFKYSQSEQPTLKLELKQINDQELKLKKEEKFIIDEYYCFEISHSPTNPIDIKQWKRINKLIESRIIENELFKLRTEGLGFIEIKAFILYLNGISPENIDNAVLPDTNIKVFEVTSFDRCKANLTYRFWLRKPIDIRIPVASQADSKLDDGILHSTIEDRRNRFAPCFYFTDAESEAVEKHFASYSPRCIKYPAINEYNGELVIDFLNRYFESKNWKLEKYQILKLGNDKNEILTMNENSEFSFVVDYLTEIVRQESVAFDDHGFHLNQMDDFNFYHPYGGNGLGKILNHLDKESFLALKHRIIEAFETRVIILDERIQRYGEKKITEQYKFNSEEKGEEKNTMRYLFSRANVVIPHPINELQLNDQKFNKVKQKQIKVCLNDMKITENDFVVIHLGGVIEKFLTKKDKTDVLKFLKDIKPNEMKMHQFVLTSERGTPTNVPDECRFIHFSNLSKYLMEKDNYSKPDLVQLITNSRN